MGKAASNLRRYYVRNGSYGRLSRRGVVHIVRSTGGQGTMVRV
jgi:hypothetical protein